MTIAEAIDFAIEHAEAVEHGASVVVSDSPLGLSDSFEATDRLRSLKALKRKYTDRDVRFVVCAAIQHKDTGTIVLGLRHLDSFMRDSMAAFPGGLSAWKNNRIDGFIDSHGDFLTRQQARKLAEENGQIRYLTGVDPTSLYSEDLY